MKVTVEFLGLPNLTKIIGDKQIQVEVSQATVNKVLNNLITKFGQETQKTLFDNNGKLDRTIQVLVNGKEWLTHDKFNTVLKEGDTLIFMMLVAGG